MAADSKNPLEGATPGTGARPGAGIFGPPEIGWVAIEYERRYTPFFAKAKITMLAIYDFEDKKITVEGGYDMLGQPFGHGLARLIVDMLGDDEDLVYNVYKMDTDGGKIFLNFNEIRLSVVLTLDEFLALISP